MTQQQQQQPKPDRHRWFEDLPWRIRYRVRRGAYHAFGPPQLDVDDDPLLALDRERSERLARLAARRAERDRLPLPTAPDEETRRRLP